MVRGEKGVERSGGVLPHISVRRLVRTKGEFRGETTREVINSRPVLNLQGMAVESDDSVEVKVKWLDIKKATA